MKSVPDPHPLAAPRPQPARLAPTDHAPPAGVPKPGLRLRLKPKATSTGYVDGAWWPRSRDLTAEVPALAHVLSVRLGRVTRVTFPLEAWDTPPRQLTVDGKLLRLEGFHSQDQYVVHATGSTGRRVILLVVPPEAADDRAHDAMIVASRRDNTDRPIEILAAGGIVPDTTIVRLRVASGDPQSHWDTNDGSAAEDT